MNNYVVYFEIGGKKMKMTVKALNEELAKRVVKDKIVFHKVKSNMEDLADSAENLFNEIFKK